MNVFQALADPTRRAILAMLAPGECSAGEIGAAFNITSPAISQHLKALRGARLVRVRVEAQRRIYRLDAEGLDEVKKWLFGLHRVWGGRAAASQPLTMAALVQARRLGARTA
jgi:DNA-binding transcriptional ArsR family regulator